MLEGLVEKAPYLAGLVIVVVLFLRRQEKSQEQWTRQLDRRDELTAELQRETTKAIRDNTEAMTALKVLIEERVPHGNAHK